MLPCDGSSSVMPVARVPTRTVAWSLTSAILTVGAPGFRNL